MTNCFPRRAVPERMLLLVAVQCNAADVIIMEGILVFHEPRVRNMFNMKIFVDTGQPRPLCRVPVPLHPCDSECDEADL